MVAVIFCSVGFWFAIAGFSAFGASVMRESRESASTWCCIVLPRRWRASTRFNRAESSFSAIHFNKDFRIERGESREEGNTIVPALIQKRMSVDTEKPEWKGV